MDEAIITTIEKLPRDQALEAARFLCEAIGAEGDEQSAQAVAELTAAPYASLDEIDQLARIVLLTAVTSPEHEAAAREAIDGAGRKQFIFGGAEIAILAPAALSALHMLITRGKKAETQRIRIREEPDGTKVTEIDREVKFGVSGRLASVLAAAVGGR